MTVGSVDLSPNHLSSENKEKRTVTKNRANTSLSQGLRLSQVFPPSTLSTAKPRGDRQKWMPETNSAPQKPYLMIKTMTMANCCRKIIFWLSFIKSANDHF